MQANSACVHAIQMEFNNQMHYAENECTMPIRLHCNELRALCLTTNALTLCRTAEIGALYIWPEKGVYAVPTYRNKHSVFHIPSFSFLEWCGAEVWVARMSLSQRSRRSHGLGPSHIKQPTDVWCDHGSKYTSLIHGYDLALSPVSLPSCLRVVSFSKS